ncbi:MAG TPA: M23 family metallopeptidase [Bacteroidia bacterium]|jgi:hypothetical protein
MHRITCLIIIFLLAWNAGFTQNTYPADYFRSPIDTTLALAGNFGEIRPNHFHAGFDIKTNGKEGMPLYAVADGYVSRIRISSFGYGKALYIRHPNGFTSVYGHMKSMESGIADFAKKVHAKYELFEIDTLLNEGMIPVKKGQFIGLSGNTGGSQGPHLHFEIRESATEKPINPYFFGYRIPDNIKPKITAIAVYPLTPTSSVNGKHAVKKIKPVFKNGQYSVLKTDTLTVNGSVGFGIETYDTENNSSNQNGVFSIELQSGGRRIYYHELVTFTFESARYVNTHIDFREKQKHNSKIQKCFLSKNNGIEIYKGVLNNGVINFTDDSVHWIKYIVKDFQGNTSELMLKVRSSSRVKVIAPVEDSSILKYDCSKENKFSKDDIEITIPANALYDDLDFRYSASPALKGTLSQLHKVQDDETALQKAITLSIRPAKLPGTLQDKACIVSINSKGGKIYEGGKFKDGVVTTQTKSFGNFAVAVDTVAPKIRTAFKYVPNTTADLRTAKTIGIIANDNLSGIRKYRAKIDGNWVLCEYEYKNDLLFYTFDSTLEKRVHTFEIEVTDDRGNTSKIMFSFRR